MYKQRFIEICGHLPQAVYAAPGRVELCGNHTDHQGGRVLAAAIDRALRKLPKEEMSALARRLQEGVASPV